MDTLISVGTAEAVLRWLYALFFGTAVTVSTPISQRSKPQKVYCKRVCSVAYACRESANRMEVA